MILVAAASVHTAAAACDFLAGDAGEVLVCTVLEPGVSDRDAGDAANVARTRLPGATVTAVTREGEPATVILETAREHGADRLVVGATRGDPATAGEPPGSTVRALLSTADRPVAVLPVGT
jgi:nucleotide-binding universal stress UspA family protein